MHAVKLGATTSSAPPCMISAGAVLVKFPGSFARRLVFHGSKLGHGPPSRAQPPAAVTKLEVNICPTVGSASGTSLSRSVRHSLWKRVGIDASELVLSQDELEMPR